MSLANEAGYLYVYSKKILALRKDIKELKAKREKVLNRHALAKDHKEKEKIQHEHEKIVKEIRHLIEKHSEFLTKLRHHQIAFSHKLQEEHHI